MLKQVHVTLCPVTVKVLFQRNQETEDDSYILKQTAILMNLDCFQVFPAIS